MNKAPIIPLVGQVIRYSFLWHEDALKGIDEGDKNRPCAVIFVVLREGVILDEANDFRWPGPDLRPRIKGDFSSVIYGRLPPSFMNVLLEKLKTRMREKRSRITQRTE